MGPEKNYKHRDIIFLARNQVHNKHFQCIPQKDAMLKKMYSAYCDEHLLTL